MKIILLTITSFFIFLTCRAQVMDNKLNIYVDSNIGTFTGEKLPAYDGFYYPGLYSNMKKLSGFSGKILYKMFPVFSIGIEGNKMLGNDWTLNDNILYRGAKIELKSVSPVFQLHTKLKNSGVLYRLRLYFEVDPIFGQSKLNLSDPIFEIISENNNGEDLMESINNFYGIKTGLGVEYAFSRSVGVHCGYSFQQNWISSQLYLEDRFSYHQVSFGIYFKFLKNKRYSYD